MTTPAQHRLEARLRRQIAAADSTDIRRVRKAIDRADRRQDLPVDIVRDLLTAWIAKRDGLEQQEIDDLRVRAARMEADERRRQGPREEDLRMSNSDDKPTTTTYRVRHRGHLGRELCRMMDEPTPAQPRCPACGAQGYHKMSCYEGGRLGAELSVRPEQTTETLADLRERLDALEESTEGRYRDRSEREEYDELCQRIADLEETPDVTALARELHDDVWLVLHNWDVAGRPAGTEDVIGLSEEQCGDLLAHLDEVWAGMSPAMRSSIGDKHGVPDHRQADDGLVRRGLWHARDVPGRRITPYGRAVLQRAEEQ